MKDLLKIVSGNTEKDDSLKLSIQIDERKQTLEYALASASFRKGISAFRYGLITSGISDHLPISGSVTSDTSGNINIFSWNLLSDDHTFNSFMNVTGTGILIRDLQESSNTEQPSDRLRLKEIKQEYFPEETGIIKLKYYDGMNIKFFFSELSQFLYANKKVTSHHPGNSTNYEIEFTASTLDRFIIEQTSVKLKSDASDEEIALIRKERRYIRDILLDKENPNHHEYQLAIRHGLEIIFHLKEGSFTFDNRLHRLSEQKELLANMQRQDILCFQECSVPADLQNFLKEKTGKNISSISTSTKEANKDHVAIMFDSNKYQLTDPAPIKSSFGGRKPYIIATLENILTNEKIIVGSIHHPGGEENVLGELKDHIKILQDKIGDVPYFIMGDYNHTSDFFHDPLLQFPDHATLTANDYDNYGKSIDGVLTNKHIAFDSKTDLITDAMPINIAIQEISNGMIKASAPARLLQRVDSTNRLPISDDTLGIAGAKLGSRD
jgi:hypothetical protein